MQLIYSSKSRGYRSNTQGHRSVGHGNHEGMVFQLSNINVMTIFRSLGILRSLWYRLAHIYSNPYGVSTNILRCILNIAVCFWRDMVTMHRRSTIINGWSELGNQFQEVEWPKCSSARFCNMVVFLKKYSRTPRPISRLTSPVSPQLQKTQMSCKGKTS